jgi:hypothetical protein
MFSLGNWSAPLAADATRIDPPILNRLPYEGEKGRLTLGVVGGASNRPRGATLEHTGSLIRTRRPRPATVKM